MDSMFQGYQNERNAFKNVNVYKRYSHLQTCKLLSFLCQICIARLSLTATGGD